MDIKFGPAAFVCTWCGARFIQQDDLVAHWQGNPDCRANRTVSNPLQSKYNVADPDGNITGPQPGADTLKRVEEARLRVVREDD